MEYIIVGDAEVLGKTSECLIYTCGTKERAEEVLDKMLNNPDKNDLYMLSKHTNLRVKAVEEEKCWWNDPFLAN